MNAADPPTDVSTAQPKRRLLRRVFKAAAIVVALLALAYGGLCWWYYSQEPRLSRNYSAELNSPILKIPPEQRAWTHYRRALERLEPRKENEFADSRADKNWPAVKAFLKRNAEAIEMIRQASKIRPMGVLLQDGVAPEDVAWRLRHDYSFGEEDAKNLPAPRENPSLVAMGMDHVSAYMDLTNALRDDAYLAAEDRDAGRMTANLIAMIDLAEQVHEGPFIVEQLVATTIAGMGATSTGRNLAESADILRGEDVAALIARLRRVLDDRAFRFRAEGDAIYYADSIQRYYTDDGEDDGVFTIDGDWGNDNDERSGEDEEEDSEWLRDAWDRFRVPIWAALVMPRRSELEAANEQYHRELDRAFALPPWERNAALEGFVDEVPLWAARNRWDSDFIDPKGHVDTLKQIDAWLYQEIGGALIALAAEQHRRKHGQWPAALGELVPDALGKVPLDQSTGEPLHYRLLDGRPLVYSVGSDRDDDGGREPEFASERERYKIRDVDAEPPPDGDWILWPPVEDVEDAVDDAVDDAIDDAVDDAVDDDRSNDDRANDPTRRKNTGR